MVAVTDATVLVTGCGAPGFAGTLWSLRRADRDLRVVGTDARREQAGRYLADAFHRVPRAEEADFVPAMLEVCREEGVDVVLPQVTAELQPLAAHRAEFAAAGATVAVSGPETVAAANDKGRVVEACVACDVPRPRTLSAETAEGLEAACRRLGYPDEPVVVKPPASNGSRGLRVLDADRDRKRAFYREKPGSPYSTLPEVRSVLGETFPRLLVTEYLPGEEYTVDAFRPAGGGETTAVPRRRDEVRSGISFRATVREDEAIRGHAGALAEHLDLTYAFGFQFKEDAEGRPHILECNPRIQGTMVASTVSGANIVYAAVADALDWPAPDLTPAWDRSFYRYWGGVGVADGDLAGNVGELR